MNNQLIQSDPNGFILIQGGAFWSGNVVTRKERAELVHVEDFEMLDHPVTNTEYQRFVDAAGGKEERFDRVAAVMRQAANLRFVI